MNSTFKALVAEENKTGQYTLSLRDKLISDLPDNEVLIKVEYSGLNYKDALSASGNKGITKKYPHTPGIDAAGVVVESSDGSFKADDQVIVTGYDLGMNTSGGFAEYIKVPASWVVRKPDELTLLDSMVFGTSGFTAASGIYEFIKHGITPDMGEVLISGATGAVGSMAVAMLANAGYPVVAVTGKESQRRWLEALGASRVIGREEVDDKSGKPLLPGRYIAALDTVGGNILSTVIRSVKERGIVANCGMIVSNELNVSVFPFILRAVRLIGIASAETPMARRLEIWKLIADMFPKNLDNIYRLISLEEVPQELDSMLKGSQTGKVVVKIS